ncbi:MAG: hypothetical protein LBQ12_11840 [Deltaproteobacteria bacterium]|nr:hypothetical protein [Deltaproteobacteria bacterium]
MAVVDRNGGIIEIEVKASAEEITRDFEKPKHGIYRRPPLASGFVPNRFLFAVPAALDVKAALSAVRKLDATGKYGVMAVSLPVRLKREPGEPFWFKLPGSGDVKILRRAGVLRDLRQDTPRFRRLIEMRLLEELVSLRHVAENFMPRTEADGDELGGDADVPEACETGGARKPAAGTAKPAGGTEQVPGGAGPAEAAGPLTTGTAVSADGGAGTEAGERKRGPRLVREGAGWRWEPSWPGRGGE